MNARACSLVTSLIVVLTTIGAPFAYAETAMVEMRDRAKLATDYYLPSTGGPAFPVALIRTTYGREAGAGQAKGFNDIGIALVVQDTRGRGGSEGVDMAFGDDGWGELQDGGDTVAWLKAQPWCNGKIGTLGGSALGITQVMLAGATQDVTCQALVVAAANFYDQISYHGGVWRKNLCEGWLTAQKSPHVIDVWKAHPTYDDFWVRHNAVTRAPQITAPAVHIGGWFDIFGKGTIENFVSRQYSGGEGAKGNQILVMGPWPHGARQTVGDLTFPDNFNFKMNDIQMEFMRHWLLGEANGVMDKPRVHYYVMGDCVEAGAPGNEWRTAEAWPPYKTESTQFYLAPEGKMLRNAPDAETTVAYKYDPADPCPTHGGANLILPAGPYDQRKVSGRKDVVSFTTEPLGEPLEITGPISVKLYVSSDAVDTDFAAKLVDVYPDGKEILIQDGIRRVKFRKGYKKAELLTPGEVGELEIDLWYTSLIFNKGHRIGVQISSSNYPRFEKNPNTGDDFPSEDKLKVANNSIHLGGLHRSALVLPVRQ